MLKCLICGYFIEDCSCRPITVIKEMTANGEENCSGACFEYRPSRKLNTTKDLAKFLEQIPERMITIHDGKGIPREDVYIHEDGISTSLTASGEEVWP